MKLVSIGALISVLLTVAISVFIGCCIVQLIMRKKRHSTKDEGQLNLVINHVHVHDEPQLQIVNAIYE
jgi:formate/nitrite transporter FocA (FNT family)